MSFPSHHQNALLLELTEEWDQYEKKIKDVYGWISKSRATFESPQYRNRPLRDQLVYLEKTLADINTQKTKITLSFEKLQVTFCFCLAIRNFFTFTRFGGVSATRDAMINFCFRLGALPTRAVVRKGSQR